MKQAEEGGGKDEAQVGSNKTLDKASHYTKIIRMCLHMRLLRLQFVLNKLLPAPSFVMNTILTFNCYLGGGDTQSNCTVHMQYNSITGFQTGVFLM